MLYPLSYEGVPIQYKTLQPQVGTVYPSRQHPQVVTPRYSPVPTRVHDPKTPASGGRTTPTMYK